jgi:hypothetical protein
MSYWTSATNRQMRAIEAFCQGKQVLDLGGYDGSLGIHLLEAGAAQVINVDKENPYLSKSHMHLTKRNLTFGEFDKQYPTERWQTAILSWPINNDYGVLQVLPILKRCQGVVYLGCNTGGSQCGTPLLWQYLVSRQIYKHILERHCTLIIYTEAPRTKEIVEEEKLALVMNYSSKLPDLFAREEANLTNPSV